MREILVDREIMPASLREFYARARKNTVYGKLQKFLRNNAQIARFGRNVRDLFKDDAGTWIYESKGLVRPWGWADVEYINFDGELIYDFSGSGICLEPGF